MKIVPREDQCKTDESSRERYRQEIPDIVDQLTKKLRAVQMRSGSENARTDPGR